MYFKVIIAVFLLNIATNLMKWLFIKPIDVKRQENARAKARAKYMDEEPSKSTTVYKVVDIPTFIVGKIARVPSGKFCFIKTEYGEFFAHQKSFVGEITDLSSLEGKLVRFTPKMTSKGAQASLIEVYNTSTTPCSEESEEMVAF